MVPGGIIMGTPKRGTMGWPVRRRRATSFFIWHTTQPEQKTAAQQSSGGSVGPATLA